MTAPSSASSRFRAGGAGRVVGEVEDDELGAGRDRGLEVLGAELEAVVLGAVDGDGDAAGELRHQRIGGPAGARDDDLVARIDGRHDGVVEDLLAAVADHDLIEREVEAVFAEEFPLHGLLERGRAVLRGIFGLAGQRRLVAGLDRMEGGREVGLADGERDDLDAGGAERAGADGHRHRRGDGRGPQPFGERGHGAAQESPWQKRWMRVQASRRSSVAVA